MDNRRLGRIRRPVRPNGVARPRPNSAADGQLLVVQVVQRDGRAIAEVLKAPGMSNGQEMQAMLLAMSVLGQHAEQLDNRILAHLKDGSDVSAV